MKAPLLIGTDVTNMTAATLSTLTNKDAIAINQDVLGKQARLVGANSANATSLLWAGELSKGSYVALLVNNDINPQSLTLKAADVLGGEDKTFSAFDVWAGKPLTQKITRETTLSFPNVGPHGCVLLKLSVAAA